MGTPDRPYPCFGEAEVLDLALPDQLLHGAGDVLDRYVWIDPVLVEEVDAVGLQAPERLLGDPTDPLGPAVEALLRIAVLEAELRRDYDLVPERGERLAHDLLVRVGAVCLRGVEKGDAALVGRPDQRDRLPCFGRGAISEAQAHGTVAEGGDLQAAVTECTLLHSVSPFGCSSNPLRGSHAPGISLPYASRVMLSGSGPPRTPVSSASIAAICSPESSKSKTSKFSAMRAGLVDFGIAERPSCRCQRSIT